MDEYDFIHNDLEPFWGVSPEDLIKIQEEQEEVADSFTISRNETHMTDLSRTAFSTPDKWQERALLRGLDEILDLLEPVEYLLPPFRAIISPHDNPNLLSDYNVKQEFLKAARENRCPCHTPLLLMCTHVIPRCGPQQPPRDKTLRFCLRMPPRLSWAND